MFFTISGYLLARSWSILVIVPLFFDGAIGVIATWLLLPIAIVTLGEKRSQFATWFHRGGDPSYGMYLC